MKESLLELKKIFSLESYEDFLQYLVKNLSGKNKLQACFLYTDFNLKTNLVYLKKKNIYTELDLDKAFSFLQNIQVDKENIDNIFIESNQRLWSQNYCKLLRDLLKRPVLPLIVIPFFSQSCVLCLEGFEGDLEHEKIKQNFYQYYDALSGSLFQIQEQNKIAFFSFLWEQSFEKNMDPMSIENQDLTLENQDLSFVKENETFKKSLLQNYDTKSSVEKKKENQSLLKEASPKSSVIKLEDSMYEPTYYNIKTIDDDYVRFCHYKDISKILFLREDLLQRKKMEALGGLADQLSNQLNNPLAGIRALVQLLQSSVTADSQLLSHLKEIESETWRCRAIIENLKNFSNKNNVIETFDLNQLLLDVVALSKVALSKSAYSVYLDKNILNIQGSRQLIQQVIFNLIINAIQAISSGDKIVIKSYKLNTEAILEIKDYGQGMSKHVQEQIFTPFFTTKKNQGTGLGLSMSLNIMKKFSGKIKVDSVEGKYTTFTLSFPIIKSMEKSL